MKANPGERWRWNFTQVQHSDLIVEIKNAEDQVILQVLKSTFRDIIGDVQSGFHKRIGRCPGLETWTKLKNQNKPE